MSANVTARRQFVNQIHIRRGLIFGAIIITALFAFELFNYSTTEFALSDLLGDLKFAGIRWATILSIAFCGIDFAGIARLFTPQDGSDRSSSMHTETWYLFGAWLLAATMNAMLTWWGISLAILGHETLGSAVIQRGILLRIVPIFVALMVWLIRVLIIGTFSAAGDNLFSQDNLRLTSNTRRQINPGATQSSLPSRPQAVRPGAQASAVNRPGLKANSSRVEGSIPTRPDPTYHPLSASKSLINRSQARSEPAKSSTSMRQ